MSDNCVLSDMLLFREKKAEIQRKLLKMQKGGSVISFGLNIPGPNKTGELIRCAFLEGQKCIESCLKKNERKILKSISLSEKAGYAKIYLVQGEPFVLKKDLVYIEENHELGRLFDIDVLSADGSAISRKKVGIPARKCLICTEDAKICARSRRHSVEELNNKISYMIETWRKRDDSGRLSF